MHPTPIAVVFPLLLSAVAAQTVWNVPSGTSVDAAIALAQPGDVLVLSGSYPPFTLDKGLTLRGPATIQRLNGFVNIRRTRLTIPAGQRAHLSELSFERTYTALGPSSHEVDVSGDASFDGCTFEVRGLPRGFEVTAGNVSLQRCSIEARSGDAFVLLGGVASLTDCSVSVQNPSDELPAPAVVVEGGTLVASRLQATGGTGVISNITLVPGQPALRQTAGAAWITDSVLTGGAPSVFFQVTAAGPGIEGAGGVTIARTQVVAGGTNPSGPSTGFSIAPELVGIASSAELVRGTTVDVVATPGTAGLLLGMGASFSLASAQTPLVPQPLFGAPGPIVPVLLTVPISGQPVTLTVAVPNLPALAGQSFWFQACELTPAGLQGSAVVGGVVR